MLFNWLDFGEILYVLSFFSSKFWKHFFKVKHFQISGMAGPIDVKEKGGASVEYWVN